MFSLLPLQPQQHLYANCKDTVTAAAMHVCKEKSAAAAERMDENTYRPLQSLHSICNVAPRLKEQARALVRLSRTPVM